jgi:hypothetical protein
LVWILAGILLPAVCFAIGFPDRPSWQSGRLSDYAQLLLSHEASLPLYPLLLGCMLSLGLLAWDPARHSGNGWIWLGIFSGVVLAIEYWFVFQMAIGGSGDLDRWFVLVGQCVLAAVFSVLAVVIPWYSLRLIFHGIGLMPVTARVITLTVLLVVVGLAAPWLAVLSLFCSTPWAVAAYGSAAIWLIRRRQGPKLRYSLAQLLSATGWLAVNFAAWRTAYQLMLLKYATLPTTPPDDCFVCCAAARGHRSVVRSEVLLAANGRPCLVNDQLRTLKAFEILLTALSPRLHRMLRAVYDRFGPRLAATLAHPLAADAAYFALKPAEWFARAVIVLVLGRQAALIGRLYRV